jgi:hypothetical protein
MRHGCTRSPRTKPRSWAHLALLLPLAAGPSQALELALQPTEVQITAVSPAATVALISVARTSEEGIVSVQVEDAVLPDTDGNGQITHPLASAPPPWSLWVATDLASTDLAVASPAGPVLALAASNVALLEAPVEDQLTIQLPSAQIWWVRPGVGLWGVVAVNGGPVDQDATSEGAIAVALGSAVGLATSPATPLQAAAGDLFLVVDPEELRLYVAKVEAGTSAEAPLQLRPVSWGGRSE